MRCGLLSPTSVDMRPGGFRRRRECLSCGAVRRGTSVLAALVACALGGAVACSNPRAGSLPPPSSPTPSATVAPTASQNRDPADVVRAALRAYFDALYAAGLDPANKADELAELIHPACTCRRVVDVLREEARLGRHIDYRYTLSDVRVIEVAADVAHVRYTVARSAGAERDSKGRVIERYPATTEKYSVRFRRIGEAWLLERTTRFG